MTSKPRFKLGSHLAPGLAAVALFGVLAAVFLTASFPEPAGFGEGSITASIGYAMFDLVNLAQHDSESFLVAFEIIDLALVAALVGAVMLGRRDEGEAFGGAFKPGAKQTEQESDD
ncbi:MULTISPECIES: NADH-quinone oxidoreductase subunit J [unclassified Haladaptatus]|uniref:NADH-quinone oxidoreductase subunit J n=1 Tax=unclassified Haladaptatus TaxID=2622732 RepID=UPI0023E7930C|nr:MULTISPECIES: NADH-quinone oxidoreductase subunit J [unclassified Haladaptatus]